MAKKKKSNWHKNHIVGTDGNDVLFGTERNDKIWGKDGDDIIFGLGGNDKIWGGDGNDIVSGGDGHDRIWGGDGDDILAGDDGNDRISGGEGDDQLFGGDGHDRLNGDDGNDVLVGGDGNDRLSGGRGNDVLSGNAGHDRLSGGDGNDVLIDSGGNDRLYGGDGDDFLFGGEGNDRLSGGDDQDILDGHDGDDRLSGGDGDDDLSGGEGDDRLHGGDGNDSLTGGDGEDRLSGGDGNDVLWGDNGPGTDDGGDGDDGSVFTWDHSGGGNHNAGRINETSSEYDTDSGLLTFTLNISDPRYGDTDGFTVALNDGPNPKGHGELALLYFDNSQPGGPILTAYAYNGKNTQTSFEDGSGANGTQTPDRIATSLDNGSGWIHNLQATADSSGNNVFTFTVDTAVINGHDALYTGPEEWFGIGFGEKLGIWMHSVSGLETEYDSSGFLTEWSAHKQGWLDLSNQSTDDDGEDGDFDDRLYGGDGDDELHGQQGDDDLRGGRGNDELDGGSGDDDLRGGDGEDELSGGSGDDDLRGGREDDQLDGGSGNDDLRGGDGDDDLIGGSGNDSLRGGRGGDDLDGGTGNDDLRGGSGEDEISGGSGDDDISGGTGNDWIKAGHGDDTADGGEDDDKIWGQHGDDTIDGGTGNDWLDGDRGNDTIDGGAGNDDISGGRGEDTVDGGAGSDWVDADRGNDLANYNMAENMGASDFYDGGKGYDTLQLTLTYGEHALGSLQQDLADFATFLSANANPRSDRGPEFEFTTFDLDVEDFEDLTVVLTNVGPTANDDTAIIDEDSLLSVAAPGVLDNDTDPDHLDVLTVQSADTTSAAGAAVAVAADGSFTYDTSGLFESLAFGANTTDTFGYVVRDLAGATDSATVEITIQGVNDGPTADDIDVGATEDGAAASASFAGDDVDSDDDQSTLTYTITSAVSEGSIVNNNDGTFTFDPGADFQDLALDEEREISFNYTATDRHGATSDEATVTVTVTGVNDGPTANDATLDATEDGTPVTTDVLTDDVDSDDDPTTLSYAVTSGPAEGSVIDNGNGTFTFDPGADFQNLALDEEREVSFAYTATDSHGATSDEATVTVTVTGVNDGPTALGATLDATEDGAPVTTSVLTDDVDSDDDPTTLSYAVTSGPAEGSVIDNGNGTFTFDPGADFQDLALGETRDVSFTYTATDSHGAVSNEATATVTVTGVNDNPTAAAITASATEDGATVSGGFAGDDVDSDDDQSSLTYTITSGVAEGSVIDNGNGTFTFDPGADFQDLALGETRDVSFTYTATDSHGAVSNEATATVTVTGVNDDPTAAAITASATEDGATVSGGFAGDDVDSDDDQSSLTYTITSGVAEGSVIDNGNGTFTFDPGADFQDLALGETRDVSFTYTATDSHGAVSNEATATVTVTGVNDDPTAAAITASATEDGAAVSGGFAGDDVDSDDDQSSLTYTITSALAEGSVIDNGNGTFTFDPGADFQDLALGETRDVSFTYTATDSHGAVSNEATATVTVTGVNDNPTAAAITASATEDGAAVSGGFAGDDVDSDDDQSSLTYTITSGVAEGAVVNNNDTTFTFDPGADFQDLALDETRDVSFTYTATDSHGAVSNEATATVTVTGVNDNPTAAAITASATEDGAAVSGGFAGDDVDSDDDQSSLTYTITSALAEGSVINNNDTTFTFDPGADFQDLALGETRDVSFTYTATDSHDATSPAAAVTVTVTGVNDGPAAIDSLAATNQGEDVSGQLTASDVDHPASALTFSRVFDAVNGTATVNADGSYTYSPDAGFFGTDAFTFAAADPGGIADIATVTVDVAEDPDQAKTLTGGDGNDSFIGGGGGDTIDGGAGDDIIDGGGGNDTISGGEGSDTIDAGAGDDTVVHDPGDGDDSISGGSGFDQVEVNLPDASLNDVTVTANAAGQVIVTGTGGEVLTLTLDEVEELVINAGDGGTTVVIGDLTGSDITNDTIVFNGGADDDVFDGSALNVRAEVFGNGGNDTLGGGAGDDLLDGGADVDTAVFAGNFADYVFVGTRDSFTVEDTNLVDGDDGFDTVTGMESVRFADQTVEVASLFNDAPVAGPDGGVPAAAIELSSLDGTDGFRLDGAAAYDRSGISVSAAGDVNGDGLDDVIVGARGADQNGSNSGSGYVVFGRDTSTPGQGFAAGIELSSLDGTDGFRLDGAAGFDYAGFSVSAAGDVNGDGLADLIVGAYGADPNGSESGSGYVVFGRDTSTPGQGFAPSIELGSLDGTDGFRLDGAAYDNSGRSVSAAGDVNGDGFDDVIVGANRAAPNGSSSGSSYVVFGSNYVVDEDDGARLIGNVLVNDTDPNGDALTVSGFDTASANGATIAAGAVDGTFIFDATTSAAAQALADGESLSDSFSYTVSDGNGGSATAPPSPSPSPAPTRRRWRRPMAGRRRLRLRWARSTGRTVSGSTARWTATTPVSRCRRRATSTATASAMSSSARAAPARTGLSPVRATWCSARTRDLRRASNFRRWTGRTVSGSTARRSSTSPATRCRRWATSTATVSAMSSSARALPTRTGLSPVRATWCSAGTRRCRVISRPA